MLFPRTRNSLTRFHIASFALLILGFGLDALTTVLLEPAPGFREGNPIMRTSIATVGLIEGVLLLKLASILVIALMAIALCPPNKRTDGFARFSLIPGTVWTLAALWNGCLALNLIP